MRQTVTVRIQVVFGVDCADIALASCEVQQVLDRFTLFDAEGVRNQSGAVNRDL